MLIDLLDVTEVEIRGLDDPMGHLHGSGGGEGFGPLQMFVAALGLCAASVLTAYARGPLGLSVAEVRLRLRWHYGEHPHRVARIALEVMWPGLPAERRAAVARAVETCTIHRTLEHPPELVTTVSAATPVPGDSLPPPIAREVGEPISEPVPQPPRRP
jgi:uncharacterized OsmC-like protein